MFSAAFTATSGDVHTGNISAVVVHRKPALELQGYYEASKDQLLSIHDYPCV